MLKQKRPPGRNRKPVYWWNREVAAKRRSCLELKRMLSRANRRRREQGEYKRARKELSAAICKAKEESWAKLIEEVDNEPWGNGYKIAVGKLKRIENVEPFTEEELQTAAQKLRSRKAPGPDGIPPEAVKAAVKPVPEVVLNAMNATLKEGVFPKIWKRAKLVLIPKGTDEGPDRKFRPICLLDAMGKLLEHMVRARLMKDLEEKGGLSDMQFGFREGLSTADAVNEVLKVASFANDGVWGRKDLCALITIDVENEFNSAPWGKIAEALEGREINPDVIGLVQSYLTDRTLIVDEDEIKVSCGVPQGSVLGPTL
jgi:hypothetical protein